MNRLNPLALWLALTLLLALALAACGGTATEPPPPTFSHAPGSQLSAREALQIRFGESMNPDSLVLGEGLGTQGSVSWSSTHHPNDTLTLSPPASGWVGQPRLSAQVRSRLGVPQPPLSASYEVVARLSTFQAASVVIGQADFSGYQDNYSMPGANTLSVPRGNPAIGPEGQFFLTDSDNNRLLGFRQLPTLNNASATIEALGNATIAVRRLRNTNEHLRTEDRLVGTPEHRLEYYADGSAEATRTRSATLRMPRACATPGLTTRTNGIVASRPIGAKSRIGS